MLDCDVLARPDVSAQSVTSGFTRRARRRCVSQLDESVLCTSVIDEYRVSMSDQAIHPATSDSVPVPEHSFHRSSLRWFLCGPEARSTTKKTLGLIDHGYASLWRIFGNVYRRKKRPETRRHPTHSYRSHERASTVSEIEWCKMEHTRSYNLVLFTPVIIYPDEEFCHTAKKNIINLTKSHCHIRSELLFFWSK